jgi:hypothetical protein
VGRDWPLGMDQHPAFAFIGLDDPSTKFDSLLIEPLSQAIRQSSEGVGVKMVLAKRIHETCDFLDWLLGEFGIGGRF